MTIRFVTVTIGAAAILAAGLVLASCAEQYSAPQQVQASNPHVTYKYHGDQELVQANQSASLFCNQYQLVPRTANISNNPDGSKVVAFECVKASPPLVVAPQYNPNLSYNYMTDQELLDATRNAQVYCMNNGGQQVISTTSMNANGVRTVAFQCTPAVIIR